MSGGWKRCGGVGSRLRASSKDKWAEAASAYARSPHLRIEIHSAGSGQVMGPDLGSVSDGGDLTVGFHVEAGERVGLGGCEECLLCAAAALGCVHGVVGVALQRFRIAALIGENSDADAGGAGDVAAIEGEGMTEAVFETGFIGVEVFDGTIYLHAQSIFDGHLE